MLPDASSLIVVAARSKGLTYQCEIADDIPNWVRGDALRLQQILVDLLSNAVKFTEHGHVRLGVTTENDGTRQSALRDRRHRRRHRRRPGGTAVRALRTSRQLDHCVRLLAAEDDEVNRILQEGLLMVSELELFYWWFHDDVTGQRLRTLYAMDRATATALYGNVLPDETTRAVRAAYQLGEPVAAVGQPSSLLAVDVRKVNDPARR